ncbi:zinc-binding dehydrogenase, partial [Pseudomonas sp. TNT11]
LVYFAYIFPLLLAIKTWQIFRQRHEPWQWSGWLFSWRLIGLMGGREAQLDLAQVLGKRVQLLGSTLRSRDDQFKADLFSDLSQHVWPLFAEGRLSPQLAKTFPIKDAEAAFAELATNQISGKLVLVIDASLT